MLIINLIPRQGLAKSNNLVLLNLDYTSSAGIESAYTVVKPYLAAIAEEAGFRRLLLGQSVGGTGFLPAGDLGKNLDLIIAKVRSNQSSNNDLVDLGRLLGVDYVLLVRARSNRVWAHLFSVKLQHYAPQNFEEPLAKVDQLNTYLHHQTAPAATPSPTKKHWYIWAVAAVLAGVTLGFALAAREDTSGELKIQISR